MFVRKTRFCCFFKPRYPLLSGPASTPELLSKRCHFNAPLGFSPKNTSSHTQLISFSMSHSNGLQFGMYMIDQVALPSLECRLFPETRVAAGRRSAGWTVILKEQSITDEGLKSGNVTQAVFWTNMYAEIMKRYY